jgi:hypothetical protein
VFRVKKLKAGFRVKKLKAGLRVKKLKSGFRVWGARKLKQGRCDIITYPPFSS